MHPPVKPATVTNLGDCHPYASKHRDYPEQLPLASVNACEQLLLSFFLSFFLFFSFHLSFLLSFILSFFLADLYEVMSSPHYFESGENDRQSSTASM